MSLAITKRKKSIIVLAWIVPIIAMVISFSMMYTHYSKEGNNITITLKNIEGLDVRQSHIQYNGLHIGDINSIQLDNKNINTFIINATIYEKYNYLIKKGSIFYKVSPKLSLNEISGLSNVLKGNYIELIPPTKNVNKLKILQKKFNFQGLDTKPNTKGITFFITTNDGSFSIGSKILYKGLEIGEILSKKIHNDIMQYQILIYQNYKYLISSTTQFYKINPLEFNATLENINLKIPSIKDILNSSISFITPSFDKNIKKIYTLYSSKEEIDKKKNTSFKFKIKANGISTTDFIIYKGIIVGKVTDIKLEKTANTVSAQIYPQYKYLINNSTYFYKPKALKTKLSAQGLSIEVPVLKELVLGGLSFKTPNEKKKLTTTRFTFYEDIDILSQNETFDIHIKTNDNYNIKETSKLYYKNIKIGNVERIVLNKDIVITIKTDIKYKYLFGKDSKIYLKGTTLSLEKIENLSSTILGDNFYLIPDINNKFKSKYIIDSVNPDKTHYQKGLRVQLKAKDSQNISIGSPIYYKGFEIGEIYDADLLNDGEFILFSLFIKEKYKNILKNNSQFFKAPIVDMDISLLGAKIKMGSAKTIFKGGIFFQNPDTKKKVLNARENTIFHLLKEKK